MTLEAGSPLPDLTAPDQEGTPRRLGDLLGPRGAVIYFYPKDNTPGCTLEALEFQGVLAELRALGVSLIGVSKDSSQSHAGFRTRRGLDFTLLSDQDGTLCQAFGAWKEKSMYGKRFMGIARTTVVVDSQGAIRRIYSDVKAKGHAAAVLRDLRAVL
ncbi:MAG: peroxiredoxin [Magnetococcales bacterium]|nr:peroxiredoxin [Magnetococcales bacterium]